MLTGNPASTFSVPVAPLNMPPPSIPVGVPSDLLERRPDVATAERQMAYQNALVGVAKAAFYPQLTLSVVAAFKAPRSLLSLMAPAPSGRWAEISCNRFSRADGIRAN